jgi:porin
MNHLRHLVLILVVAATVAAQPDAPAGWRTDLGRRGVELAASYTAEAMAVPHGGLQRGAVAGGGGIASVAVDCEKATGLPGARAFASLMWLHGASVSQKLVGDTLAVSNLDGYDSLRLYECWFEQAFLGDRASLRAGALLADAEFAGTDSGGQFFNSVFGWPAFISGNTVNTGPAFYVAAAGARLRLVPAAGWQFQCGVYDGDTFDSPAGDPHSTRHGLHHRIGGQQGWFGIAEIAFRRTADGRAGVVKLGAWRHSSDFPDNYRDHRGDSFVRSGLAPRRHAGIAGSYASVEQILLPPAAGRTGIAAHARIGASQPERAQFAWVLDTGLNLTGLLPGRPADVLALGFAHASVSRDARRRVADEIAVGRATAAGRPDYEQVFELSYRAALGAGWILQPDVQWVRHTGTTAAGGDVLVLGLRLGTAW